MKKVLSMKHVVGHMSKGMLSFFLAMTLIVGAFPISVFADTEATVTAAEVFEVPSNLANKTVIIHTNDVHGGDVAVEGVSIGTAGVLQLVNEYKAAGADVILISAGDAIQGDPLVNISKGKTAIEFMNLAGYDMIVPGNHEYDFGYDVIAELEDIANFPFISANIIDKKTGLTEYKGNIIFETALGKVGVFGISTPETLTKANPNNVASLNFLSGEEMYKVAQKQVDELKAAGAKVIICVAHLGIDEGSAPNRSTDLLDKVTGIDLMIDGHSHSLLNGEVYKETVLVSTGSRLSNVGVVILDGANVEAKLVTATAFNRVDETVNEVINKRAAEIDLLLSEKFATTEILLDGNRDPGVRTQGTNLGDFAADAILWSANEAVGGGVSAAITNGGGIRASIQAGDVTMKDMKTVFPFGNTISTVKITGAQLLEVLEASTFSTPLSLGAFPQVSGIEFTLNTALPYTGGAQFPDSTYYAPASPGTRVTNVKIAGEKLDPNKTYTIATNDFLAAGGDTYYLFKSLESYNTYVALEDALINYTDKVLDGVISKEKYGESAGRISIIDDATAVAHTETQTYTVLEGDYLWLIAQKYLGTGNRFEEIYELNKNIIKDANVIYAGQVLEIPVK